CRAELLPKPAAGPCRPKWGAEGIIQGAGPLTALRHEHAGRAEHPVVHLVALLDDLCDAARLEIVRRHHAQSLGPRRVARLAVRADLAAAHRRERLVEKPQREPPPFGDRLDAGLDRGLDAGLDAVAYGQERLRELLGAEFPGILELARAALAEVVE